MSNTEIPTEMEKLDTQLMISRKDWMDETLNLDPAWVSMSYFVL